MHLAATGLHAVRRTAPLYGENGIVVGLGLVGQFTAQFAQLSGCHVLGVDRFARRRDIARQVGIERVADPSEQDVVEQAGEFTQGYGMDFGIIAFGGEASDALETIYQSLKQAPDTHRMGRIVLVGGAQVTHGFGSALGNVDVRSAARTGPGYHDLAYERGQAYPEVFVEWPTQRNLAECLCAMAAGEAARPTALYPRVCARRDRRGRRCARRVASQGVGRRAQTGSPVTRLRLPSG